MNDLIDNYKPKNYACRLIKLGSSKSLNDLDEYEWKIPTTTTKVVNATQ